jgi:ectoine hydroxylase-related dioxygenase (phytanoyl-CoA dioxygenase family)
MSRTSVRFGQALLFTPCLIHGLAMNNSGTHTRMALELRLEVMD